MKMNHNESIEVVVSPEGEIQIDAQGFSGSDCEQATAFLEQVLGQLHERNRKSTYYARRRQANANQQEVQS